MMPRRHPKRRDEQMLPKISFRLFAIAVISLAATTAASARGGGGDYPAAVSYSDLPRFNPERACRLVQRRVLTRNGQRTVPVRVCG